MTLRIRNIAIVVTVLAVLICPLVLLIYEVEGTIENERMMSYIDTRINSLVTLSCVLNNFSVNDADKRPFVTYYKTINPRSKVIVALAKIFAPKTLIHDTDRECVFVFRLATSKSGELAKLIKDLSAPAKMVERANSAKQTLGWYGFLLKTLDMRYSGMLSNSLNVKIYVVRDSVAYLSSFTNEDIVNELSVDVPL